MAHHASTRFWTAYDALPPDVQAQADRAYDLLVANPRHPSLQFKRVGRYWSARVSKGYRAVAMDVDDGLLWFRIGPHAEYDKIIK